MAYRITDDCIGCGACEPKCPVGAISESGPIYAIDEYLCNNCDGYSSSPICKKYCPTPEVIERIED